MEIRLDDLDIQILRYISTHNGCTAYEIAKYLFPNDYQKGPQSKEFKYKHKKIVRHIDRLLRYNLIIQKNGKLFTHPKRIVCNNGLVFIRGDPIVVLLCPYMKVCSGKNCKMKDLIFELAKRVANNEENEN